MFYSLGRLLIFCFELVSSCFQLFATFGCSAHHHQDYQQHNNGNNTRSTTNNLHNSQSQQAPTTSTLNNASIITNGKTINIDSTTTTTRHLNRSFHLINGFHQNGFQHQTTTTITNKRSKSSSIQNGHITAIFNNNKSGIRVNSNNYYYNYDEPIRPRIPFHMLVANIICHGTLMMFGHLNDFLRKIGWLESFERVEKNRDGYTPLYNTFAPFYIRNIVQRLINMWAHPICSAPSSYTEILERKFGPYNATWKFTGNKIRAINMGSYDYLGHSENKGPRIDLVVEKIRKLGVSISSSPNELGTTEIYRELEKKVAKYLGVEDSVVIGMGFATNSLSLPSLFGPGSLVISDECNHASLALGCKISGAKIRVFKHNDMRDLENIIRESIAYGQPQTSDPWKKIVILVEGIYSMEGTIVNLPELIRIKKKYRAYVYMDEAHSIGAMGSRGRGICDYYGCDPRDIDILMGTFTKSFAAAGGYIAGEKRIINYIRTNSASFFYGTTMSPAICQQISSILDEFLAIDNNNNTKSPLQCRISQLRKNVVRFRQKLKQLGFHIDGNDDSPVVPLMVYTPTHLKCLISKLLEKGVASTGASYPVTSLVGPRARFCLSAGHTDQMIDYALKCLDDIGTEIGIKFNESKIKSSNWKLLKHNQDNIVS